MAEPTCYVYAVAPASTPESSLGVGIDEARVELVVEDGLAAVIHQHGPAPYEGADDDARRWILEHSEVVEQVWQLAGTVLPMSFNVLVAGTEDEPAAARLRGWLRDHTALLTERLEALQNRVELRIDITLDTAKVSEQSDELAQLRNEVQQRPAGAQRLLDRRIDQRERDIADALADRLYPEYRRRLALCSDDFSENRHPVRSPDTVSVLTGSVLVPAPEVERVGLELAAIRDEQPGVQIAFLGPWPPYSFAELPQMSPSG